MKKRISIVLTLAMILCMAVPAYTGTAAAASYDVGIILNGEYVDFPPTYGQPFISDEGRTLVPLRGVAESYGCSVRWDPFQYQVIVRYGSHWAYVHINQYNIYTDSGTKTMNTYARIIDGRTYLPIRYVMEAMGANVNWDGGNRLVIIENPDTYTEPLDVLKASLVKNGTYDTDLGGYTYTQLISRDSGLVSIIKYDPNNDDVSIYLDLPDSSGDGYSYLMMDVGEAYYELEGYDSGISDSTAELTWSGFFDKTAYESAGSYDLEDCNMDVAGHENDLIGVTVPQVCVALQSLDSYCRSFNVGITPADLGFAR